MHHFKHFPTFEYDGRTAVNVLARAKIREMILKNTVHYYPYVLADSDRPDIVSHKYYGSSAYTWILFYANNVKDPIFDWLLPHEQFLEYVESKYGSLTYAKQTVHHYENERGYVIDETTYSNIGVLGTSHSLFDYEHTLNEAKREVKIIDSRYRSYVVNELKNLFD
jgi:hypothetical protein